MEILVLVCPYTILLSLLTSSALSCGVLCTATLSELATQLHVADVLYKESHRRNYFNIVSVRI